MLLLYAEAPAADRPLPDPSRVRVVSGGGVVASGCALGGARGGRPGRRPESGRRGVIPASPTIGRNEAASGPGGAAQARYQIGALPGEAGVGVGRAAEVTVSGGARVDRPR